LEAVLFSVGEPLGVDQLARLFRCDRQAIEEALMLLQAELEQGSGIMLQRMDGNVQLVSHPLAARWVEAAISMQNDPPRLSRAALEVLAIVAYRQPATLAQIEDVRGVSSSSALRTLVQRGLVRETSRASGPGRPILYAVTADFLQVFGLSSVDELPPLPVDRNQNE
jgi:segregation and condensation protein B